MAENKKQKNIKQKLKSAFYQVLILTLVISFIVTQISIFVLLVKTKSMLVDQAINSAEAYTTGRANAIDEQISGIVSKIEESAKYTEFVYENPTCFNMAHILTPDEFTVDKITENTIHWLPFDKEQTTDEKVASEADLLAALEPNFKSLMATCPSVVSLYVATNTGVNIGYDMNVLAKQGIFAYNPVEAGAKWYNEVIKSNQNYISDMYTDTFGRGSMITIAVPYSVDGSLRGVIGADIVIENINKDILEDSEGTNSGTAYLLSASGDPLSGVGVTTETKSADLFGNDNAVNEIKAFESGVVESTVGSGDVYIIHTKIDTTGWKFAIVLSVADIVAPANEASRIVIIIDAIIILINVVLLFVMTMAVTKLADGLTKPLTVLTEGISELGEGNLDYKNEIETGDEIQLLSESFEIMTNSLKEYINNLTAVTAEKERIGAELDVAAHIQLSMLPCIFPAFPDRKELDIYATMTPAKEVGGDFYDFFMIDERHLAIVVADVSGKGVPAALFMVIGKTLIKDHTQAGLSLGEVFSNVNNLLCEANSEGLFITAFEGVLDLVTGEFTFVNAGHEMPCISRQGQAYEPYKIRPGFVLAGMEGMKFKGGSITLEPGDKIFQYTDGVTEATNAHNELFGMDRMVAALTSHASMTPEQLLPAMKADIDAFVGEAPQFDDITMLCLEYRERMVENQKEETSEPEA